MNGNLLTYETLKVEIRQLIAPLDGIVLIDPEDGNLDCWVKSSKSYWVIAALDEVAAELCKPIFMRQSCINPSDDARTNMLEYYWEKRRNPWVQIDRFDNEEDANRIGGFIRKERDDIYLGFGGALSESCVKKKLMEMCSEVIIPNVQRDSMIQWNIEKIGQPFRRGRLIYEFTENRYVGFSLDPRFNNALDGKLEYRRGF